MKVAIIHDWLIDFGGAEKVLEELVKCYPTADIHTLFYDEANSNYKFLKKNIHKVSRLNNIPFVKNFYRSLFPLFPYYIEQFDLSDYDLVISSSHSVAKGVITPVESRHICYCHSPARFCWDLYPRYMLDSEIGFGLVGSLKRFLIHRFRMWDVLSSARVDMFIANSEFVSARIKKFYRRDSSVIYPPVSIDQFYVSENSDKNNHFVVCCRLVPYKKINLLIDTFSKHFPDLTLKVIGDGPELKSLKKIAGKNVHLLGYLQSHEVHKTLSQARAFVYAAHEDFGISIIEALASGLPVIAFGKGSSKEILQGVSNDKKCGILFGEQTVESCKSAIEEFLVTEDTFDAQFCRDRAKHFASQNFTHSILEVSNKQPDI